MKGIIIVKDPRLVNIITQEFSKYGWIVLCSPDAEKDVAFYPIP